MQTERDVLSILIDRNKVKRSFCELYHFIFISTPYCLVYTHTQTPTLEYFMKEFVVVPELDYSLVVHRLLGETEFWARDALLRLLHDNMFPSRYNTYTNYMAGNFLN